MSQSSNPPICPNAVAVLVEAEMRLKYKGDYASAELAAAVKERWASRERCRKKDCPFCADKHRIEEMNAERFETKEKDRAGALSYPLVAIRRR